MARCDQGYLCQVCGQEVESLVESTLYLQYVAGWLDADALVSMADSHLRCQPVLAQFIEHPQFDPRVFVDGDFDRRKLDSEFVAQRSRLLTDAYQQLIHLSQQGDGVTILDYPLRKS